MENQFTEHRLVSRIPDILAELLGDGSEKIEVRSETFPDVGLKIVAAGRIFLVEFKVSTTAAQVAAAVRQLLDHAGQVKEAAIPLLAVPFMGPVGRRICEEAGLGWFDLSGNAHIIAPGLRVIVSGQPNRFRGLGRPPNLFAPKSSRLIRWLLINPYMPLKQREIAHATELDEGFVSRLVSRLVSEEYVVRDKDGGIRPRDPALLLDDWHEAYRFAGHAVHRGHVPARSGDALTKFVRDTFDSRGIEYAATGLAAAWELSRFAMFRTATFYLPDEPQPAIYDALGFRDDPRGANLWLVIPNDAGVFHGAIEKNGLRCVHPVQVYVDLKDHPERAPEAAERLRGEYLNWRRNGDQA